MADPRIDTEEAREAADMDEKPDLGRTADRATPAARQARQDVAAGEQATADETGCPPNV